ncbi:MAG: hypothetical protein IH830_04365 [Planctomycetes bacterium]|nr:hypothetical protein [Planctomycetota bacterium]
MTAIALAAGAVGAWYALSADQTPETFDELIEAWGDAFDNKTKERAKIIARRDEISGFLTTEGGLKLLVYKPHLLLNTFEHIFRVEIINVSKQTIVKLVGQIELLDDQGRVCARERIYFDVCQDRPMNPGYKGEGEVTFISVPAVWHKAYADPPPVHLYHPYGREMGRFRTDQLPIQCAPDSARLGWLYMRLEDRTEYGDQWMTIGAAHQSITRDALTSDDIERWNAAMLEDLNQLARDSD